MENALDTYRRLVNEQPVCDEAWFAASLARIHARDEEACRAVSGRCLRLALEIAERRTPEFQGLSLLDVVQEANVGLWNAVHSFQGTTMAEFLQHARLCIENCLQDLATELNSQH